MLKTILAKKLQLESLDKFCQVYLRIIYSSRLKHYTIRMVNVTFPYKARIIHAHALDKEIVCV